MPETWKSLFVNLVLIHWQNTIIFFWVCWFLAKNLSDFVSFLWKLINPYCHSDDTACKREGNLNLDALMPGIYAPAKNINKKKNRKKEKEKKCKIHIVFFFVNLMETCFEKHRYESFHKTTKKWYRNSLRKNIQMLYLKFMFYKKATKFDKIFTVALTFCSKCQIDGEDFIHFCGLLRKYELY